ncbi:MAG: TIGR04283 family arsenosugar biosynthesis glycosyltransferase [Phycisphaerae bacterium]
MLDRRDRLILFGRYPEPGKVKTRLVPALGPAGAADLQRRLTERALAEVRRAARQAGASVEVRFAGGDRRKMRRWLGDRLRLVPQGPGDLGHRMRRALFAALADGDRRVVLVGTDVPGMTAEHLGRALEALTGHDVVLGPSADGGYWLVGLRRRTDLFAGIDWGTPRVLDQTLRAARAEGRSVVRIETLSDLDTPDDLAALRPEAAGRPYLSVIVPALNESAPIAEAIATARAPDAEILVVDGGSADATVAVARDAGARVLSGARGRAGQQNLGAAEARGRVLLFLHADTRLPAGYVGHVFEALMDPRIVGGAFRFRTDLDTPWMRAIERLTDLRSRRLRLPYGDQALFVRREAFEALGGFPKVPIAEDLHLVRRLNRWGRVVTLAAPAVTSARRWRTRGRFRTTLVHQAVVAGIYAGVPTAWLARLRGR